MFHCDEFSDVTIDVLSSSKYTWIDVCVCLRWHLCTFWRFADDEKIEIKKKYTEKDRKYKIFLCRSNLSCVCVFIPCEAVTFAMSKAIRHRLTKTDIKPLPKRASKIKTTKKSDDFDPKPVKCVCADTAKHNSRFASNSDFSVLLLQWKGVADQSEVADASRQCCV